MRNFPVKTMASVGMLVLLATSCDSGGGGGDAGIDPAEENVDLVVHTDAGGGSDVFARAVTEMLREGDHIGAEWPVQNVDGGSGAQAMAHMAQEAGNDTTIAAVTMTWITTPLTLEDDMVDLGQLTPIAQVLTEPTFIAVPADAPYEDMAELAEASADGEDITQVGGSPTAHASLVGTLIQEELGAEWRFLSFAGGGERISALLGGDADLMLGSLEDFEQHVESGDARLLAVAEDERMDQAPDVPTLAESGVDVEPPDQVRGFVGPPEMSEETVEAYEAIFRELAESQEWQDYLEENAWIDAFAGAEEWGANLDELANDLEVMVEEHDLADEA